MTKSPSTSQKASVRPSTRLDEIVDVAAALFAEYGYVGTGVADLGDAVGLGRGALYYHIGSKENLLGLIHDRVMTEVLASARHAESLDVEAEGKLEWLGQQLVEIITKYPDHVWVFLHEHRALTGELALEFRRKRRTYERSIASILAEGVERGRFTIPDRDLTVLAWLGLHNYTYMWFRTRGRHSPSRIAATYHHIFMHGICSVNDA